MSQFTKVAHEKGKSDTRQNDLSERKSRLNPMEFRVTQERQTEKPFSNKYNKHWETGSYNCIVCDTELFRSDTKFESSSGWPAFSQVVESHRVKLTPDLSHVGANLLLLVANPELARTEVSCANCNAHLGHLFKDGPKPTNLRYCINSASLNFVSADSSQKSSGDNNSLKSGDPKDRVDGNLKVIPANADSGNKNSRDNGSEGGCTTERCPTSSCSSKSAKICFFQSPNPSSSINFQPTSNVMPGRGHHMVNSNSSGNLGRPSNWKSNGNGNESTSLVRRRISLFSSAGSTGTIETVSTAPKLIILRETSL